MSFARLALRSLVVLGLGLAATAAQAVVELTVSAAASLTHAMRDIAPAFEAAHPDLRLQFNFGASGALLQQIAKGAPADVFVSADQETMDEAQRQGLVQAAQRRNVVSNALVVIVPAAATRLPAALHDLAQPGYARIAVGLPASVPAGRYTRSALEAANLWSSIQPKVIGAHHVRQALDYVARAEVDAGFVYATDAALMPDRVRVALRVPTPRSILYPAAPLATAPHPAAAVHFVDFLLTPPARAVLARYGFGKP